MRVHQVIRWLRAGLVLGIVFAAGGCANAPRSPEPTIQATVPAPAQTPIVSVQTATATPPQQVSLNASLSLWRAADLEPFCLIASDSDGDGDKEWVGLHQGLPGNAAGVRAFVLDGGRFYALGAQDNGSSQPGPILGDDAICELSVRDVNADGRVEVVVFGQNRDGTRQLNLFQWDSTRQYRQLGRFAGVQGVTLQDDNGNGALEIIVASRYDNGLVLEEISAWDGQQYVHSHSRYARVVRINNAGVSNGPEPALINFYVSLQERDVAVAYQFLSPTMRSRQSYEAFLLSQAAVRRFELGEVRRISDTGDAIVLAGDLLLTRMDNAQLKQERFAGEWRLQLTEADWRIDQISLTHVE